MGKFAIIVGIPGVGKTTVLDVLLNLAKDAGIRASVENMGSLMLEAAKEAGTSIGRDKMRTLSLQEQAKLRMKAIKKLVERKSANDLTILDTHFLIRSKGGYLVGLPKDLLDAVGPEYFGIIEASVQDILSRRAVDATRSRDEVNEEEVKLEQDLTRTSVFLLAALYNANVIRVTNEQGKASESGRKFYDFLLRG